MPDLGGWEPYVAVTLALVVMAIVGMQATTIGPWYRALDKPPWQPPDWLFGPAWTTIYIFIAVAVGQAWNNGSSSDQQTLLWLVGINFVLNMLWSILFFTLRRPGWALVEVVFLWMSILILMISFHRYHVPSAWFLLPYLAWTTFASVLNLSIVRRNGAAPRFSASGSES